MRSEHPNNYPASEAPKPFREILAGISQALPIMLGYIIVAGSFGILAREAGFAAWQAVAMSTFVFAGAAQFIALSMFTATVNPAAIIITTFLVNLRHILMSASLAPFLQGLKNHSYALLGWGITDETFALNSTVYREKPRHYWFIYGTNFASYSAWVGGTAAGAYWGTLIPGIDQLPLGFVLPAMFISLLVMQITDRVMLLACLIAAGLSIAFSLLLAGNWNIVLAAVVTATILVEWEKWINYG